MCQCMCQWLHEIRRGEHQTYNCLQVVQSRFAWIDPDEEF